MVKKINSRHIISAVVFVGMAFTAFGLGGFLNRPLFENLDNFVLFGQEEVKLEQGVQVSSGDLGSNKNLDIEKDSIINGNLFSDKITIDKNSTINGNTSFNKLDIKKESQILGIQTKPIQLPIANLPEIPEFTIGAQDFKFEGQNNTLSAGNYRNITLEKDSRLVLEGGIYNLNKLEFKENSTFIFNNPTTLNIQSEFKTQQHISILPGNNLKPGDLVINYQGGEEKDGVKPIEFGKDSFLNFKLLAPKAEVIVGEFSTIRGQVLAKKIMIRKDSILSREEVFVKISDLRNVITDEEDGSRFFVNEIVVNFTNEATREDADTIAGLVNGRITGFVPSANIYQIEVATSNIAGLEQFINQIRAQNNPKIEGVIKNYLFNAL